jgi:hypothetical protein
MSTLSAILKEIYEGDLREQLNNDVVGLRRLERSGSGITSNVGGKYVTFPVHYGRNGGIGARREMEDLPAAGNQATAAAQTGLKYQYGSISLSGQALKLADTNAQAFLSALELETNGLKTDLAKNLNQEVYRSGNGQVAATSTTTTGTTAVITSGWNNLSVGMLVDVYTAANLAADSTPIASGRKITAMDSTTNTVTLDASTAFVATSVLVRAGSANREWTGLAAIVNNSGILYNVNPSNVDQWRAVVDANGGSNRALTEGRIITNVDAVRTNGGKTSLILTSLGVRRAYFALLVQQRQFINTSRENKSFDGGFTGLAFTTDQGDIPIVTDVDCPPNTMWGLSEKNIKLYREADWSFMNEDGNMWVRVPGSTAGTWKDAYSATMFQYSEIGSDRRNVHFKIADLTEG